MFTMAMLAGCQGVQLWVPHEEQGTTKGGGDSQAPSRPPLDVPPDMRGKVEVPMPDKVAGKPDKKAVAGKHVALDTRVYEQDAAVIFDAAVDAMTALNLPVQSVDSPSGTITTAWIRPDADNPSGLFGPGFFGGGPIAWRHRFVVRVLRLREKPGFTRLEIRTLGQAFMNRHWVNKPVKRKVSNELFKAVEEQLARRAPQATPQPSQNP